MAQLKVMMPAQMPKVCLMGRHSNRVPLAYLPYKVIARNSFEYVSSPFAADFVVLGFARDIQDNEFILSQAIKSNKNLKIVVLSEEPLWISVWSEHVHCSPFEMLNDALTGVKYYQISSINSDLYEGLPVPYFITTDHRYMKRYATMLFRNSRMSSKELLQQLKAVPYHYAFVGERRDISLDKRANAHTAMTGLSGFRATMSELVAEPKLIKGFGWNNSTDRRQSTLDWHLEKLALLDRQVRFMGAIENTFTKNYLTEKIFDALACCSVPVVWSESGHEILDTVGEICINVFGLEPDSAAAVIDSCEITEHHANSLVEKSGKLLSSMLRIDYVLETRKKVVNRILHYFSSLVQ